ncbi:MAG: alpha/beta fold hydrolase [Chloroflexota bacterium]
MTRHRPLRSAALGAWVLSLTVAVTGLAATPTTVPSSAPAGEASAEAIASLLPSATPSPAGASDCPQSPTPGATGSAQPSAPPVASASPVALASPAPTPCPSAFASIGDPGLVAQASAAASPSPSASPPPTAAPTPRPTRTPKPTPTPTPTHATKPGKVRVRTGIAYMDRLPCGESSAGCVNRADVYYPSNHGPWPVIVTIHGRPRTQRDMAEVARALAAKGAVVYNVDYRGVRPAYTKGFPESITDVACAVRWARSTARRYGGDPSDVVLVGHSQGGYVGAMAALVGDTFKSDRAACHSKRPLKDSLPQGYVAVAAATGIHTGYRIDQAFLGGTRAAIPDVWRRATIYNHIGRNRKLKVGIIFERHDPYLGIGHATNLYDALKRARYDVRMVLLEQGTTHFDILDTDLRIGRQTVAMVWSIVKKVKDS